MRSALFASVVVGSVPAGYKPCVFGNGPKSSDGPSISMR